MASNFIPCIGCGALVPETDGPTHRYMESSPGCWEIYGEVLAREYSDRAYAAVHRLTVDAYAVQHPGTPSEQSIHSVGMHLMRLFLIFGRGYSDAAAGKAMPVLSRHKHSFCWLAPPESLGSKTVLDVWKAEGATQHTAAVREWAESAWQAWLVHHEQIREWCPAEMR